MSSNKKSQQIFLKNLNNRHPTTIKEMNFFGTTNSFDEQKPLAKCDSPKFFRTQGFGIPSPKSQIKFFANGKNKNTNFLKENSASTSVSDSDDRLNSRSGNCSESSVSTLAQVQEIFDESCDFDVGEVRGLERLKRLRCRFRKSSFSVESNVSGNGRNKR